MRLIDADALKKAIAESEPCCDVWRDIVDNAPTVKEKSYTMGYQDGLEDSLDSTRAIEILTNFESTACNNCHFRPCGVPCEFLKAVRYAIRYMKGGAE